LKGVQKMAETAFPEIIKAATKWQPSEKWDLNFRT
jgi:hypothetical protein